VNEKLLGGVGVEPFAVVVADATGVIQSWNAEAQRMFGYSADDVIGRTLDVIIPEPYRDRHWTGFRAVMNSTETELDHGAVRVPVKHRDGTIEHCAVRLVALLDPWDRAAGAAAVFMGQSAAEDLPSLPEL
jgi:PAS domain S-box-containing protein